MRAGIHFRVHSICLPYPGCRSCLAQPGATDRSGTWVTLSPEHMGNSFWVLVMLDFDGDSGGTLQLLAGPLAEREPSVAKADAAPKGQPRVAAETRFMGFATCSKPTACGV